MTFSRLTLSITIKNGILDINDAQHNDTQHKEHGITIKSMTLDINETLHINKNSTIGRNDTHNNDIQHDYKMRQT
jgi:hypothetical protein